MEARCPSGHVHGVHYGACIRPGNSYCKLVAVIRLTVSPWKSVSWALFNSLLRFCLQLARPFCLGLPNTLPLKGLASSGFPCGSSLARRAVFLSSRPVAVYWVRQDRLSISHSSCSVGIGSERGVRHPPAQAPASMCNLSSPLRCRQQDYLRLHTPDLWVSASAAIMLLRVGVVLLAPSTLRHRWVCAAHRLLTPVTLLLQLVVSPGPSPAGTPLLYGASPHAMGAAAQLCAGGLPCATSPSMLSTWFARVYPLLDAMYTIIFPVSSSDRRLEGWGPWAGACGA